MSAPTPTTEPARIVAGDTAKWLKLLADYSAADGWVLTYTLVSAANRYTFSAAASGSDHLVTVSASTTVGWAAGDYALRGQVAKAGEVFTVVTGRITVDAAFGSAFDARSQLRRTLEAVEATLEGRASSAVAEYQIAGRMLKHIPIGELLMLRDRMRFDVQREEAAARSAAGLQPKGRITVRFGA